MKSFTFISTMNISYISAQIYFIVTFPCRSYVRLVSLQDDCWKCWTIMHNTVLKWPKKGSGNSGEKERERLEQCAESEWSAGRNMHLVGPNIQFSLHSPFIYINGILLAWNKLHSMTYNPYYLLTLSKTHGFCRRSVVRVPFVPLSSPCRCLLLPLVMHSCALLLLLLFFLLFDIRFFQRMKSSFTKFTLFPLFERKFCSFYLCLDLYSF